jgi:hypothetical protein
MADELLLQAFEMEISAISQQFCAMVFVFDVERIAS